VALRNYLAISRLFCFSRKCFLKIKRNFLSPSLFGPKPFAAQVSEVHRRPLDSSATPLLFYRPQPSLAHTATRSNPPLPISARQPARSPSGPSWRNTLAAAGTPMESGASTPRRPGETRHAVRPLFS
jgi:hypothetical protein